MAGRRARSLVYDDVRDAGQALPAADQFTEYTAIAASFAPLASASVVAPPPPPLPGTPSTSSAGADSAGTPEFESIIKNFTERLLAAITDALGSMRGIAGPEAELGIPAHLRGEERRERMLEPARDEPDVERLPALPEVEDDRDPHERVLDRAAKKRADRRERLGLPPELPDDAADPLDLVHDRAAEDRAARRDRMGLPPELPRGAPVEEPEPPKPARAPGLDDAIARDAPKPEPAPEEPAFVIPDRDFTPPPPAIPESRKPPAGFGGAAVEDVDSSFQLTVSTFQEEESPSPPPLPELAAEQPTPSPEFQPPPPQQETPTEPQQPQPSFTFDEINDIFVRHGESPELPPFVNAQRRPKRGPSPEDPMGHKRYADEKHDEQLGSMGVLDSMLNAQEDIGRQHSEYNSLLLDYLERLGKDNSNDARRLRALNAKLQRDRSSLTDVNI